MRRRRPDFKFTEAVSTIRQDSEAEIVLVPNARQLVTKSPPHDTAKIAEVIAAGMIREGAIVRVLDDGKTDLRPVLAELRKAKPARIVVVPLNKDEPVPEAAREDAREEVDPTHREIVLALVGDRVELRAICETIMNEEGL